MGLKPEHHGELNSLYRKSPLFRQRYAELRKVYGSDPEALQTIDIYDPESSYHEHSLAFRDAIISLVI